MAPLATTTFLFTDIEGSTRRWEERPDMFDAVEEHFRLLRDVVGEHGGEIFATLGDGVAAAFSSAEAGVRAATAAQLRLGPGELRVRMGLHTGEAERSGDDYLGRSVNRAARIMAAAHGGQVVLSDVTAVLARAGSDGPELLDLGTHRLRDLTQPERLWQLVHPALDHDFPPVRTVGGGRSRLPEPRTSLVGRHADTRAVVALLRAERLVTLIGVGGVGKTRLAVAAADASESAVWFVPLAGVRDAGEVVGAVAAATGMTGGSGAAGDLASALAPRQGLLVLDNCEHVLDGVAEITDAVLTACPEITVLATSREAIDVDGERVHPVRPLEPRTSGAALFRQRAMAAGAELAPADHDLVPRLCRRLDGLPLAIELAAARTTTLGVAAILEVLDRDGPLTPLGRRRGEARQSTMRATIAWSYGLLDADQQALFRWLSAFPGGFELDAAAHVAASAGIGPAAVARHVEALVHQHMVAAEPGATGVRFSFLETMRAFALQELGDRGERTLAACAMAEWVATVAGLPSQEPCASAVEANATRLVREGANWRDAAVLAATIGDGALAGRLCGPPANFFLLGRHDLADIVRPLLATADAPEDRRAVLCALVVSASGTTDPAEIARWVAEVETIERADPTGLGQLMRWLTLAWERDFDGAVDLCVAAAADQRLARSTRDVFVGIAVLDRFSLTGASTDPDGLVPAALAVAEHGATALARVTCRLGAAWASASSDPERALRLVRRALAEVDAVPPLTRLTLPGSASRLLTGLDPRLAARGLLDQLSAGAPAPPFDLVPRCYAAALLHRLGHPIAERALAALAAPPTGPTSMMDFVDLARRAAAEYDRAEVDALDAGIRLELARIAEGGEVPEPADQHLLMRR